MKGKGVGVQIDFLARRLKVSDWWMRRASTQEGADSLHQCLSFFPCCCDKTKHNSRDKGFVWLTVPAYSQSTVAGESQWQDPRAHAQAC